MAQETGVPLLKLGTVGGTRLVIGQYIDLSLDEIAQALEGGLERALA